MARIKRTSLVLETARQRLAGLKSIDPAPDFGEGMNLAAYEAEINAFAATLDSYHRDLSALDERQNAVDSQEAALREKSRRMLRATEAKYGPNSSEFEQAGGKRVVDHKPRKRNPVAAEGNTNNPASPAQ